MQLSPGAPGTFEVYGFLLLVSYVFIWKMVRETRGKTFEQIHHDCEA